MAVLFDTHAHYDDPRFDGMRGDLLRELFAGPVGGIVNAGTNPDTNRAALALAETWPRMWAAVGIHPEDCGRIVDRDAAREELRLQLLRPRAVALGEIGLDFHWPEPSRDLQTEWFEAQMELAKKTGKPVVIHDREAHGACLDVVRAFPSVRGVFHSFSGSAEMGEELIRRGWYLSFSGVVTFKNAERVRDVVRRVPDDRLLIETDCPYLAPEPMRGQTNHSGFLVHTAAMIASVRGVEPEKVWEQTAENACRLFGITLPD